MYNSLELIDSCPDMDFGSYVSIGHGWRSSKNAFQFDIIS